MAGSEKCEGFILFHRKARKDWKWRNPQFRSAWIWLLVEAEWAEFNGLKRGQVRFSVRQAEKLWGMSKGQASRFLKRCVDDGSIAWSKGHGGRKIGQKSGTVFGTQSGTVFGTVFGTVYSIVTILNYDLYQDIGRWSGTVNGTDSGTQSGTVFGTSPNTSSPKTSTKKKKKITSPPATDKKPTLISFYHDNYVRLRGVKPRIVGGRDAKILKQLVEGHGEDEVKRRLLMFIADNDPFLDKVGRGVNIFSSRFMGYERGAAKPRPTEDVLDMFDRPEFNE